METNSIEISTRFSELEAEGRVRLQVVADDTPYDASYIDTWEDIDEEEKAQLKDDIRRRINREGVWGIVTEYLDLQGRWRQADSCWGFIGEDYLTAGYFDGLRQAAIDALADLYDNDTVSRLTYAEVG